MKILNELIGFQKDHGRAYDLSFSLPSAEESALWSPLAEKEAFKKIAQHYSGSLICLFDKNLKWQSEESPIWWIDANGSPNLPAAGSIDLFLSILPYGTGIIYDVLYLIEKHKGKAELNQYLQGDYPPLAWKNQLKENEKSYKNHERFVDFLSANNIKISDDPLGIIKWANNLK